MKVKEAAEFLNKPVKELLDQLIKAVPTVNWKADSEVPEEFVEKVEAVLESQGKKLKTDNQLPKQQASNAIEAVGESGVILEGLDFAINQSLADERTEQLLIETAYRAVDDFQEAEMLYAQIAQSLSAKKMRELRERRTQIDNHYSQKSMIRNSSLGKLQGELAVDSANLMTSRQSSQNLSNQILQAALGQKS